MKKLLLASLCFLMLCASQVFAQNKTVTGTVSAKDDGLPLPGVTVKVTGTTIGTQTNANGKFTLSGVPASAKTLTFSFVGFESQTLNIGNGTVNAILGSNTRELTEVVVTAGGLAVTKGSQGYATTQIKPEALVAGKAANVGAALAGKVAGLQVNIVSGGVNPTVSLVMRGYRSLTGNNNALIVLDNVIVPSSLLGNINPEDIDDIQVLNGAGGAALYGSDASNGVVIITTKKGKKGAAQVRASQTVSAEKVSYFPKVQTGFGSGTDIDIQRYLETENQQYGPAFDGKPVILGFPLQDGSIQTVPYSYNDSKQKFWETGVNKQSDFSVQSGDDKGSTYVAGQYYTTKGTTPGDAYNRVSIRANGTRQLANKVSLSFTTNYVQNHYDITSQTGSMYDQLLQTPGQAVVTDYKDFTNNKFATIDGYYNFYYPNPYFTAANNRQLTNNNYIIGTMELKWDPFKSLSFTSRTGITSSNGNTRTTVGKYSLSAYTKTLGTYGEGAGTVKTQDQVGQVDDSMTSAIQLTSDAYATFKKQIKDFNISLTAGGQIRQNKNNDEDVNVTGLLQPGLYNVGQRTVPNLQGSQSLSMTRQQALYGVFNVGYKGYLNLHVTGRNDWVSVLAPENRSFFYPAADVSFIPTEAFEWMKNNKVLSSLKIRAGVSKVGNVNISAYGLTPTFSSASGFPYSGPGYTQGDNLVSPSLRPEVTKGLEFGADADLYNGRISASVTYYKTASTNQTVTVSISGTTGFTGYKLNTGELDAQGIESSLSVVPVKTTTGWQLTLGANFVWNDNKVISLPAGLSQLDVGNGNWAIPGSTYPTLEGRDYLRDNQGRIIVNAQSGYPSQSASSTLVLGNTSAKRRIGANFELRYKTLRLSAVGEYRGGYIVQSSTTTSFDFSGAGARTAFYNRERFVIPNSSYADPNNAGSYLPNTNITVADGGVAFWSSSTYNTGITTNYVYNGAYWKLREANLTWDIPKSLIGRQKYVKSAQISLQGRNLLIWLPKSNLYTDPDFGSSGNGVGVSSIANTPPTRYYGATLSLTF
ncbi:MAG: SusC/RagA family TonB-linked outer membrane protein [Bacteroidota bacterium]